MTRGPADVFNMGGGQCAQAYFGVRIGGEEVVRGKRNLCQKTKRDKGKIGVGFMGTWCIQYRAVEIPFTQWGG